jgi:hypothetical protein
VTRHYATVRLSEELQSRVRDELDDALLGDLGSMEALKKRLTARAEVLATKEDQYLELVGSPGGRATRSDASSARSGPSKPRSPHNWRTRQPSFRLAESSSWPHVRCYAIRRRSTSGAERHSSGR